MNNKNLLSLVGMAAWLLSANVTASSSDILARKYAAGVKDSAVAESAEIAANLIPVTPDNNTLVWNADKTLVKVVTWKSQSAYQNFLLPYTQTSSNENFVIWVTMAPRIHDFCHNYLATHSRTATPQSLDLRLKQRLGLYFDWQYDVFVEMWVSPEDLFRPCVDPDPSDSACDLNFGGTMPTVKNIADYGAFYKNLYFNDFRAAPGVPWTGLGYTYDWFNPRAEQGESEFILAPSSPYEIVQAVPTWQYCSQ